LLTTLSIGRMGLETVFFEAFAAFFTAMPILYKSLIYERD